MIKKHKFILSGALAVLLSGCSLLATSEDTEVSKETDAADDSVETVEGIDSDSKKRIPEEDARNVVSFYAFGDNLIHSQIIESAETAAGQYDFKPIYAHFADDIENADLAFINQESIIGGDDLGFTGYPAFNTPSDMAENLVDLGFDIVTGSNNHSLDRGTAGVLNTLSYWDAFQEDVLFTGVFDSQEQRDEIPLVEVDDLTFSVLTYTYGTNGILPEAPYLVNYFDPDLITEDVQRAQEMSDFVIVAAHMGDEHTLAPNQMQLDYAQLFADLGVDVMVGSHSHTIQPIEWKTGENGNETLVIYSLGNFLASTPSDINLLGGSLHLDFVEENGEHSIENVWFQPHLIHYEEAVPGDISSRTNFKIHKLEEYSEDLATRHALYNFEDNVIDANHFQEIVEEVIPAEFLK